MLRGTWTVASPDSRAFAVRLALCMSIGEILRRNGWLLIPMAAAAGALPWAQAPSAT